MEVIAAERDSQAFVPSISYAGRLRREKETEVFQSIPERSLWDQTSRIISLKFFREVPVIFPESE